MTDKHGKCLKIVDGAFSTIWNEGKSRVAVFNGATFITSVMKEGTAHQHVQELAAETHKSQVQGPQGSRNNSQVHRRAELGLAVPAAPILKRHGIHSTGCKGKTEKQKKHSSLSMPQKRAHEAKEARHALGPGSAWAEVSCMHNSAC